MANWRDIIGLIRNSVPELLLRSRSELMSKVGTTFGGGRKHYEIFGWPVSLDWDYYEHLYKRGGIARRIVVAYPQATWRSAPVVSEIDKAGDPKVLSPFEEAWKTLVGALNLFHYLERADRLARLGTFSLLFMGYSDAKRQEDLVEPVGVFSGKTPPILYLQAYGQNKIQVNSWEDDYSSPRYGLPKIYQITFEVASSGSSSARPATRSVLVHHSRTLHIAEDQFDCDSEGAPCLEPVLNYLLDLEKVHGSSAESFFQQSPPLLMLNADKEATIDSLDDDDTQDKVESFIHGYKRWLSTQGMTATMLAPQLGDPSSIKEMLLELIAGTTGIPKRILVGSERGELASTQDETAWNSRVEERQMNWAEPMVLRKLIDIWIDLGILPKPAGGYGIVWTANQSIGEEAQSRIATNLSSALASYASASTAQEILPPDVFLETILMLDPEVVDKIRGMREELWELEYEGMKEAAAAVDEEGRTEGELGPFVHKKTGKKSAVGKAGKPFSEVEHPRGKAGKFREKGAGLSEKAKRAKASHVTATREMQRAAIKNERDLAKRIKAKHLPDNEPFDVRTTAHAFEVKTILVGKHDKITMRKECRERKIDFASKNKLKMHTVVFDNRSDVVYYSKGVGSFRLGSMERLGTINSYGNALKRKLKEE